MKPGHHLTAIMVTTLALSSCSSKKITYPEAPHDDTVDNYFGIQVPDPYRPLENDTSAQTLAWVEAERKVTDAYLSEIPFRDDLHKRIESFQNYAKRSLPYRRKDNRYYFSLNSGLENQSVLYRMDSIGAQSELFLDPNRLSDDGTVALKGTYMSPDGKYTAYTISRSGSDWTEIYVLDTDSLQLLDDHIEWAKFTGVNWYGDGFFYSAYDRPTEGKEFSNANESHRIYYHRLGTPQSADTVYYEDKDHPLYFHTADIPEDSHYIFVYASGQGFGQAIKYRDLDRPNSPWLILEPSQDVIINPLGIKNGNIYFLTSIDAPKYRLMATPVDKPARPNWVEIIPERDDAVLAVAQFAGDNIIATYSKDASDHVFVYSLDGKLRNEISFDAPSLVGIVSYPDRDEVMYNATNYLTPWSHYSYDIATGLSTPVDRAQVPGFNPDDYITEEAFYPSTDGTSVHMFITHKKDIKLDGTNPTYLYGYGGFNNAIGPSFSANRLVWLENGGIYVDANLRGGSEYGDEWHEAGTKMNKINVFNDFISAAQYLIDNGYTSPEHLVIEGASNGGLLVAASVNMRPDLFAVAIPRVGVQDMLRYHLFTIGWNWAPDYGTVDDSPEMAAYLRSYSPLHNIKNDGTKYPAILVTTADHDDRVVPAHSFKYAAALQAANTGDKPKLIRIDSKAGHGGGKPIGKIIDEWADIYSFIFHNLGLKPKSFDK